MGWILGYTKVSVVALWGYRQHILSTECLGYGFVVIVWVSAFNFLRLVAGLKKKGFWDTYGMDIKFYTSLLVALWGYRQC